MKKRPFYVELPLKFPPAVVRVEGILYPIMAAAKPPSGSELQRAEMFYSLYGWRGSWRTTQHPDFFTRQVFNYRAAAFCNVGLKYAERHDWDSARMRYWQALSVDPHLSAAYNDLGVTEYEQHHYDPAIKNFQWALRYEPRNAGFRQNLDLAEQALKQPSR